MIANAAISMKQKSGIDLIWQNENVGASFGPQTISLPTGYSAFAIEFRVSSSNDDRQRLYVPFSTASRYAYLCYSKQRPSGSHTGRYIESSVDGSIEFGDGYYAGTYGSYSVNNNFSVPTAIYGLKFTL